MGQGLSPPAFRKKKGTSKEEKYISRLEEKSGHYCLPKAKGRSTAESIK